MSNGRIPSFCSRGAPTQVTVASPASIASHRPNSLDLLAESRPRPHPLSSMRHNHHPPGSKSAHDESSQCIETSASPHLKPATGNPSRSRLCFHRSNNNKRCRPHRHMSRFPGRGPMHSPSHSTPRDFDSPCIPDAERLRDAPLENSLFHSIAPVSLSTSWKVREKREKSERNTETLQIKLKLKQEKQPGRRMLLAALLHSSVSPCPDFHTESTKLGVLSIQPRLRNASNKALRRRLTISARH